MTFHTADGKLVTSATSLIDYNPILPNQTSPFKVIATYNPAMKSASIVFKYLGGPTIPFDERKPPQNRP